MIKLRIFITILGMTIGMVASLAQSTLKGNAQKSLQAFRHSTCNAFENFRREAISEYTKFVRNPWKEFDHTPAIPVPREDTVPPVVMPKEDKDKPLQDTPIAIEDTVQPINVMPQPVPVTPIIEVPVPIRKYFKFCFYGTEAKVRFDIEDKIRLENIEGKGVAEALAKLSDERYDNMIVDCLALRDSLKLCDWAYLQMLKSLSDSIEGKGTSEAAVMLAYLYMQSGYKMRLGSDGKKLYMLYATKHVVFDNISYSVDGNRYYGLEKLPSRMFICDVAFPREKELSLLVTTEQKFTDSRSEPRSIYSKAYKDFCFSVSVNKNLLEFYETYPTSMIDDEMMTRWAMYANTPMEPEVKATLYPQMRKELEGLSQDTAVERILNWIQTGFEYEYDDNVWGGDRAFFSEETLFYPYCDCEDRAILLTRLVRDLLNLKCVLIYYPGHLASAVELPQSNTKGDYVQYNGRRFIIADGTYINAPLGRTMPNMSNASAKLILLEND